MCGNDRTSSALKTWLSEWTPAAAAAAAAAAQYALHLNGSASMSPERRSGRGGRGGRSGVYGLTAGRGGGQWNYSSSDYSDDEEELGGTNNIMCIVGPTGCGKTSGKRCLCLLMRKYELFIVDDKLLISTTVVSHTNLSFPPIFGSSAFVTFQGCMLVQMN